MKITRHENFNLSFHRKVLKEKFLFILICTIKEEAENEICIIDVSKYDRTDLMMHAQVKFDFGTDTNVNLRYIMSGKIMR